MKTHLKGERTGISGQITIIAVCGIDVNGLPSMWYEDGWEYLTRLTACKNCDRVIGYKR